MRNHEMQPLSGTVNPLAWRAVGSAVRLARGAFLLGAFWFVTGCVDEARVAGPGKPDALISDATHQGGTPGFYFLPPMVPQPAVSGTFDADIATLKPQLAICDVTTGPDVDCGGAGAGASPAVIVYTTTTTPAITVDATAQQYLVNWDTKSEGFREGRTYRLHVTAGAAGVRRELGFADVYLPRRLSQPGTGDPSVRKHGQTLAVHFRIETGIPGGLTVSAAAATVGVGGSDLITATVQDLHGTPDAGVTVDWSVTTTPSSGVADPTRPLNPTSGQTDVSGMTGSTFTAGTTPGSAVVRAGSAGLWAAVTLAVTELRWASISAGYDHTCGLTPAGVAYCWGFNDLGELGDGTTTLRMSPAAVVGGLRFSTVSAGSRELTCGTATGGNAYCWGENLSGALGIGTNTGPEQCDIGPTAIDCSTIPVAVAFPHSLWVTTGADHACGLGGLGGVACWGYNGNGELGDGTTANRTSPVDVVGGLNFTMVSAGGGHTCGVSSLVALGEGREAFCWGDNREGQLGDGTTTSRTTPVLIAGGLDFVTVSAGTGHTCAVTRTGPYCWGANFSGQLGDGTTTSRTSPAAVAGGLRFYTLTAGFGHSCGLTSAGTAYCWGGNSSGELGDGTTMDRTSPTAVLGGLTFSSVSAGAYHTCGVTTAGAAYCWGSNRLGALGNPAIVISSSIPVRVLK